MLFFTNTNVLAIHVCVCLFLFFRAYLNLVFMLVGWRGYGRSAPAHDVLGLVFACLSNIDRGREAIGSNVMMTNFLKSNGSYILFCIDIVIYIDTWRYERIGIYIVGILWLYTMVPSNISSDICRIRRSKWKLIEKDIDDSTLLSSNQKEFSLISGIYIYTYSAYFRYMSIPWRNWNKRMNGHDVIPLINGTICDFDRLYKSQARSFLCRVAGGISYLIWNLASPWLKISWV